jgi:hypothetical protein
MGSHRIRMEKESTKKEAMESEDDISQSCVRVVSLLFLLLLFFPFAVRPIDERDSRNFLTQLSSVRM